MPVPIIGAGVTAAGRGLAAYLAKKRAANLMAKKIVNYRGRVYPADGTVTGGKHIANKFVNAPRGVSTFAKRMGIGGLAAGSFIAGDEYGKRHPREEAMRARRITSDGSRVYLDGIPYDPKNEQAVEWQGSIDPNTGLRTVTGVYRTAEEAKAASFAELANNPNAPMDQRISALLRLETGAAYSEEEARNAMEILRARDIENLNMTRGGKQMLMDDLRNQTGAGVTEQEYYNLEKALRRKTGAAYTGGEIDTFMGLLRRKKSPRSEIDFDSLYR